MSVCPQIELIHAEPLNCKPASGAKPLGVKTRIPHKVPGATDQGIVHQGQLLEGCSSQRPRQEVPPRSTPFLLAAYIPKGHLCRTPTIDIDRLAASSAFRW